MSEEIRLIRIAGSGPEDRLFDELLREGGALSDESKANLEELRQILARADDHVRFRIEYAAEASSEKKDIFDVLALDLATAFPATVGDATYGGYTGQQVCLCYADAGENENDNWYNQALQEYFSSGPGGSLLSLADVRQSGYRWWLMRPDKDSLADSKVERTLKLEKYIAWKTHFDPSTKPTSEQVSFEKRFEQFAKAVFHRLGQTQSTELLASTAIVWIYVGPRAEEAMGRKELSKPPWSVSLFAVIRPAQADKPLHSDWLSNQQLKRGLLKAIERLYLHLESYAYQKLESARIVAEVSEIAAQAVAHEFKNLTQEIPTLGSHLYQEFIDAFRESGNQGELIIKDHFSKQLMRLDRLSTISRLISAVALATYWLTASDDLRRGLRFDPDPGCKIFEAAVHLALSMYKESRPEWLVKSPPLEDVCRVLSTKYGTSNHYELVQRLDVALLLFVISEPVRNLRCKNPAGKPEVEIYTEISGQSLFICQKTIEKVPGRKETSIGAKRIDQLLHWGKTTPSNFAKLYYEIDASNIEKPDGNYDVLRKTKIDVFGVPWEI